jgi:hypothetical protein
VGKVVVGDGVIVDFGDANIAIFQVLAYPVAFNKNFGMFV